MENRMIARYRRWFEYETDSHAKTLSSLDSVPEAERSSPAFQKAVGLFAHIITARRLWLYRFGVSQEPVTDIFPQGMTAAEMPGLAKETEAAWTTYLESLDDEGLARVFEYQSLDGGRFRNSIEDILTQLFGHSWYHRGQIASLVKSLGGVPAVTDFVYWSRESIGTETG